MANNEYVNKVLFGNNTIMDISNTTAEQGDVIEGQVFYTKSGAPATGILGDATISTHGLMSVEDKVKLDNINEIQIDKTIDTPAAIMSFPDGADNLPMALTVGIEPVQDLHEYDNPWPGGGTSNLFDETTATILSGEWIRISNDIAEIRTSSDSAIVVFAALANTTYTVSVNNSDATLLKIMSAESTDLNTQSSNYFLWSTGDKKGTITTGANDAYLIIQTSKTIIESRNAKIQIELGSTATEYHPYSNVCTITGWTGAKVNRTGKNLLNNLRKGTTYTGTTKTFVFNNDGTFTISSSGGTSTSISALGLNPTTTYSSSDTEALYALPDLFVLKAGKTYTIKDVCISVFTGDSSTRQELNINALGISAHEVTQVTPTVDMHVKQVRIFYKSGTQYDGQFTYEPMVCEGTDDTYEAYKGNVYPITFPNEAGTVYGGTLTVEKDGSGTLVVDKKNVTIDGDTVSFTLESSYNTDNTKLNCTFGIDSDDAKRGSYTTDLPDIISDKLITGYNTMITSTQDEYYGITVQTVSTTTTKPVRVIIPKSLNILTTEQANTWVASIGGIQVVYALATPVTYTLTPGQVKTLLGVNNVWADTGDINSVTYSKQTSGLINTYDKVKLNSLATVSLTGNYNDLLNKPDLSAYLTTVPIMVGATSSAAGTAGLAPAPTSADVDKFLAGDGTYKSGGLPMVILSYGSSTWAQFEAAYNNNVIVYCRASSNSNPASGSQTRMAFMAYVNNATTPTNVEFQYYRSVSSHSATQMGDQVFVYKLDKTSGWSVTTREASIKEIDVASGSKLGVSWSSNKVTLSNTMTAADMPMSSSDATKVDSAISTLSEQIGTKTISNPITLASGATSVSSDAYKTGNVVQLRLQATFTSLSNGSNILSSMVNSIKPKVRTIVSVFDYNTGKPLNGTLWITDASIYYYGDSLTNKTITVSATYLT